MAIGCIVISFDEDASPNGAEGFKSWLQGMIDFHLPNMAVNVRITDPLTTPSPVLTTDPLEVLADKIWAANKGRGNSGKIYAIKDLRLRSLNVTPNGIGIGLKEAKDYIDAAVARNP